MTRVSLAVLVLLSGASKRVDAEVPGEELSGLPCASYEACLESAAALAASGAGDEAARLLRQPQRVFPEDYTIPLRLGQQALSAGRALEAEQHFAEALELSPTGEEARWGWEAAIEQQECRAEAARDCPQGSSGARLVGEARLVGLLFPDEPEKDKGLGALAALTASARGWRGSAAYRHLTLTPARRTREEWVQHEVHAAIAHELGSWDVSLMGAWVDERMGLSGQSFHEGAGVRTVVDREASESLGSSLSVSHYADALVLRWEASWQRALGPHLTLTAAGAAQWANTTRYGHGWLGSGSVTLQGRVLGSLLWLGGRFGEEFRPAYLGDRLIYNTGDRPRAAVWLGASVPLATRWTGLVSYGHDWLRSTDGAESSIRRLHSIVLGVDARY